mmetsp:Transcript_5135/g.20662  ORF Transcript_5135/g.20662 Transcript_5135/m.20662 type:complete len:250 (+) Transcript_5135:362-1111(+)
MRHSTAARCATIAPVPPAPSARRNRRPSNASVSFSSSGFSGFFDGGERLGSAGERFRSAGGSGLRLSSATNTRARTCGAPEIHVTLCHATATRAGVFAANAAGSCARISNVGGLGDPGTRFGARISSTQCCRKSVPSVPSSLPEDDDASETPDGDEPPLVSAGHRIAPASACSMNRGDATRHAPTSIRSARRNAPASDAAAAPTTASLPKAGMFNASAYSGSMAFPHDDVSIANQPGAGTPLTEGRSKT